MKIPPKEIARTLTTQTLSLSTGCTSKHLIWTFEGRAVQCKLQYVYFPKSLSGQEEWLHSQGGPSFVLCSWSPDALLETPVMRHVATAPPWAEGLAALKHSRNMRNCWTSPRVQTAVPHHLPSHHSHGRGTNKTDGVSPQAGCGLQLELSDFIAWS